MDRCDRTYRQTADARLQDKRRTFKWQADEGLRAIGAVCLRAVGVLAKERAQSHVYMDIPMTMSRVEKRSNSEHRGFPLTLK
jgi:hypothetical protein